jgi:hypothetical protein
MQEGTLLLGLTPSDNEISNLRRHPIRREYTIHDLHLVYIAYICVLRVVIRKAGTVPLQALGGYLEGKCNYDTSVVACINFLDHLICERPVKSFIPVKRSLFQQTGFRNIGGGVEA